MIQTVDIILNNYVFFKVDDTVYYFRNIDKSTVSLIESFPPFMSRRSYERHFSNKMGACKRCNPNQMLKTWHVMNLLLIISQFNVWAMQDLSILTLKTNYGQNSMLWYTFSKFNSISRDKDSMKKCQIKIRKKSKRLILHVCLQSQYR